MGSSQRVSFGHTAVEDLDTFLAPALVPEGKVSPEELHSRISTCISRQQLFTMVVVSSVYRFLDQCQANAVVREFLVIDLIKGVACEV
jgi:hypothetical protein